MLSFKVKDRDAWRDAMENGSYDKQCDDLIWSGKTEKIIKTNLEETSQEEK